MKADLHIKSLLVMVFGLLASGGLVRGAYPLEADPAHHKLEFENPLDEPVELILIERK